MIAYTGGDDAGSGCYVSGTVSAVRDATGAAVAAFNKFSISTEELAAAIREMRKLLRNIEREAAAAKAFIVTHDRVSCLDAPALGVFHRPVMFLKILRCNRKGIGLRIRGAR